MNEYKLLFIISERDSCSENYSYNKFKYFIYYSLVFGYFCFRSCKDKYCILSANACDNERHCFDSSDEVCSDKSSVFTKYRESH